MRVMEGLNAQDRTQSDSFQLRFCLPSCMYGQLSLDVILPEVHRSGATVIDLWPMGHGNQREQAEAMGWDGFQSKLDEHEVSVGCLTRYDLGPFGLQEEMALAGRLKCPMIVTGGKGPVGLEGQELKQAVATFVEKLKPHLEIAARHDVTVSIENHANNLIHTPDSIRWLADFASDLPLTVALAPYHLETLGLNSQSLGKLIRDLGANMSMFYAWQYGMGCMTKLSKPQELLQMPGRGTLDFTPILEALKSIQYQGWTEVFMHPVPRGIPILPSAFEVTREINRARRYLESSLKSVQ
ncbi:MAG: sugar phosphate isomerase/epimerase [Verrucomicrobia bacterium]|nr:sugar phosphate isomerase/epimerase [Verrucomicrobiota bacterium]